MKNAGIVRRIDDLGRIVVPKEIRRMLHIREGDSLEIFAGTDGEIMLKKYSPIGELSSFAGALAESLSELVEGLVCVADREHIIAAAGIGKKEVEGEPISEAVERLMERRASFVTDSAKRDLSPTGKKYENAAGGAVLSCIMNSGDCHGAVILFPKTDDKESLKGMEILAKAAAGFIGCSL